ncbi:RNA polymerase sigma24 factor [Virgisporangium aliadipatigenens]|uniref:RNA polymerase sigma24 factor n=1 Tax=Virgisporangium aliadipatigenens TaxID=741659 RepID=A0A8J4DPM2_9ACTN|nr:SigE family RNA polymerase sigma factor [Virgisporangium aliadipatigenens]GIJ45071.1 RNA polymerase sigma24 factor [Virgisporangium aliadipatigenens]
MTDEREQFAAYVLARRDVVRRSAYLLCGDWHFADDLVQMTFVRVGAGWRRIRDHDSVDRYVRTTLMRTYLAETRRWFRRRERSTDTLPAVAGPSTVDDDVSRRVAVAAALRRLTPGQRAVVVARYYLDLDVAATAEALGCSTGTVKSQTSRALNALKEHLGDLRTGDEVDDVAARPA